ncbi:MAG: N-6 DNA methylase [Polyangiaceae bacterium]|nr:N-6 DNA methylase [Polyangiaceae bacterium]
MNKLGDGSPELALPALGSFLWSERTIRDLNGLELANEDLLKALKALCYVEQGGARYAVSWRNIGAEELGSVYESLLELHPEIHKEAARFELKTAAGHERKTTGSYYTPTSLVDCLLDSALDPVLDEAVKKPDPEKEILELKVCDPACGSGHFLVAAARRIALRLASVRAGGDEPSPPEVQRALRDVVGRCIYGVDLNPMAVELCKVSLWMEAIEPGKPLSFLENHIQEGNALLGATPALMAKGIPDEAFEPIEGDDKEVAKRLKKRNKKARETGQETMFARFAQSVPESYYGRITTAAGCVEEDKDDDISAIRKKEQDWDQLMASEDYRKAMFLADAWCAAFVWPKQKGALEDGAISDDLWHRMEKNPIVVPEVTRREVNRIARDYSFFHWHLAFPQVFFANNEAGQLGDETTGWVGGFDVVLGNPPWEQTELKEKEWFAERSPSIVAASTGAIRKRLIAALVRDDPALFAGFVAAKRSHDGIAFAIGTSGRYPLCGRGRINTYAVFAELNRSILSKVGRAGCIVPSGIATDDTTKLFFQALVDAGSLVSLYDFQSGPGLFGEIGHARFKFCLLTFAGAARASLSGAQFAFSLRDVRSLEEPGRKFILSATDIRRLNPNTRTCPIFRGARDADLTKSIYAAVPVLVREATLSSAEINPWGLVIRRVFNMGIPEIVDSCVTSGAGRADLVPIYESKMFHQYTHRFGDHADKPTDSLGTALPEVPVLRLGDPDYQTSPRFWIRREVVTDKLSTLWKRSWLLTWRDICRAEDVRTVIACVLPFTGTDFTVRVGFVSPIARASAFIATINSFVFDYCARQMTGGTHLSDYVMRQLPVYPPSKFDELATWTNSTIVAYIEPRALELTYTAWDLEPFAKDFDYDGPPFRWDEQRRFLLRCELDAAFFHLYGISRADVDYIMDTFPIVKRKDIAAHGDYRTKTTILDIYDRMQRAIDTGVPYQTLLDPPPADPRVAHPPRETKS